MESPLYGDEPEVSSDEQKEAVSTEQRRKNMKMTDRIKENMKNRMNDIKNKFKNRMIKIKNFILGIILSTFWFRFLADLFPLAGLVVLLFSFLSPVTWQLNPSPAMQLRPYVAPEGYLPDIQCSINSNNLLAAAVLNNTNITSIPALANTSFGVQEFFAKGGGSKGGGEEGSGIGDFFSSLADAFDVTAGSGSGASPSNIAPHGDFDEHPNATVRLWLGPLGSCSRDLDGRKWCTKASYRHPKYNISSFIQPNAYLYPAIIQSQTLGRTTLAFIVFAIISCILSFIGNFKAEFNGIIVAYDLILLISEAITLWTWAGQGFVETAPGVRDPRQLNTINALFQCNQTTGSVQINPGIQYYILLGEHYGLLWVSVVLLYLLGLVAAGLRGVANGAFEDKWEVKGYKYPG